MNVCLISREYPPFFGGGIGTYAVHWAKALAGAGHQVVVVTISDDGAERQEEKDGVNVVRLPFIRGEDWSGPHPSIATPEAVAAFRAFSPVSVFAMQVAAAMPRLMRAFSFDIIEAPDTGALAWFGLNSRRTAGVWRDLPPVVTMIHSPTEWIAEQNRAPLKGRAERDLAAMERESAEWSDGLVCPSAYLADWCSQRWGIARESIAVVPYALGGLESIARTSICERLIKREPAGRFSLLYAGRLEPRKGVDRLLAGFARAADELPGLTLDLVGEDMPDPDGAGLFGQNSLVAHVPERLRNRVRLLGRKTPEEVAALRGAADAVVIPSAADNFPFACLEAMAEARLVIASSGGGIGEMIGDGEGGVPFAPGDAGSLASAIKETAGRTAQDLTRRARGAAGRAIVLCGNRAVVPQRIEHFERVLKQERVRGTYSGPISTVNPALEAKDGLQRLEDAVRDGDGIDFVHGWARGPDGTVHAHATPSLTGLSLASRVIGPVVMKSEAAGHPSIAALLRESSADRNGHPGGVMRAESTWVVAVALCAAGFRGAVVPDAVFDAPLSEHHPADLPTYRQMAEIDRARVEVEFKLRKIHNSRGWKVLQRVYGVLHVLRGRGLHRATYHEGERARGP